MDNFSAHSKMVFFPAWEHAPAFSARPQDQALEQRIAKLIEFAAKNGPPFVDMLRQKQHGNPEYDFLSGGTGSDYFQWKLYCLIYSLDPDQPLLLGHGQQAPHQVESQAQQALQAPSPASHPDALEREAQALPPDVESSFAHVLSNLNSTRASIKESKEWFMAQRQHAAGLAARMALFQTKLPTYDQQICIIYLANDVLLKSMAHAGDAVGPECDPVARAFQFSLPVMLHSANRAGGGAPEVLQRLTTILDHWGSRHVFPATTIDSMRRCLVEGPQAVPHTPQPAEGQRVWEVPASSAPAFQQALAPTGQPAMPMAASPWNGPHPAQAQPPATPADSFSTYPGANVPPGNQTGPLQYQNTGFVPPTQLPFPMQPGFPQAWNPGMPMPPPHPQPGMPMPPNLCPPPSREPPTDPFSFPPGLLPDLVKESLRTEDKYHPLSRADVAQTGIPQAADLDAYLLARLDKFYAELRDYKPGTSRAELEDDEKRQKTRNALGETESSRYSKQDPKKSDGSFKGERRDGGPAGLGFGMVAEENLDDPFSQYRKNRSGYYHDSLSRAQAQAAS